MAMLAFFHFEKFKNQFQLTCHFIHDTTLRIKLQQFKYCHTIIFIKFSLFYLSMIVINRSLDF
jgi:hypothetical protein